MKTHERGWSSINFLYGFAYELPWISRVGRWVSTKHVLVSGSMWTRGYCKLEPKNGGWDDWMWIYHSWSVCRADEKSSIKRCGKERWWLVIRSPSGWAMLGRWESRFGKGRSNQPRGMCFSLSWQASFILLDHVSVVCNLRLRDFLPTLSEMAHSLEQLYKYGFEIWVSGLEPESHHVPADTDGFLKCITLYHQYWHHNNFKSPCFSMDCPV